VVAVAKHRVSLHGPGSESGQVSGTQSDAGAAGGIRQAGTLEQTEHPTGPLFIGGKSMGGGGPACWRSSLTAKSMGCLAASVWLFPSPARQNRCQLRTETPERLCRRPTLILAGGTGTVRSPRGRWMNLQSSSPQVVSCAGSPAVTTSFKPPQLPGFSEGRRTGPGGGANAISSGSCSVGLSPGFPEEGHRQEGASWRCCCKHEVPLDLGLVSMPRTEPIRLIGPSTLDGAALTGLYATRPVCASADCLGLSTINSEGQANLAPFMFLQCRAVESAAVLMLSYRFRRDRRRTPCGISPGPACFAVHGWMTGFAGRENIRHRFTHPGTNEFEGPLDFILRPLQPDRRPPVCRMAAALPGM